MAFKRETAHRLFAEEFNASRVELKGNAEEREPSFVVSPLGAKVNRVHVVGVCTDVEPVGESGEVYRARISDPTGIYTVYAGQYQPEAAQVLSELQPPCFVAVTGKARTYEPEPGTVFVSIRPETVSQVDEATRDQWVLAASRCTLDRIEATEMVGKGLTQPAALQGAGIRADVATGALLAQEHYGTLDVSGHRETVRLCLQGLLPGGSFETHTVAPREDAGGDAATPAWTPPAPAADVEEADAEQDAFDDAVLAAVQALEGDDGAQWDLILERARADVEGATDESVESSLNRLMDKGLVYEPTLGVLRTT